MNIRDPEIEPPPAWLETSLRGLRRQIIGPGSQAAKAAARHVLRMVERDGIPAPAIHQGAERSCVVTFTDGCRDLYLAFRRDGTAIFRVIDGFQVGPPVPFGRADDQGRVSYDYQAIREAIDALFPPGPPPAPICVEVDE